VLLPLSCSHVLSADHSYICFDNDYLFFIIQKNGEEKEVEQQYSVHRGVEFGPSTA